MQISQVAGRCNLYWETPIHSLWRFQENVVFMRKITIVFTKFRLMIVLILWRIERGPLICKILSMRRWKWGIILLSNWSLDLKCSIDNNNKEIWITDFDIGICDCNQLSMCDLLEVNVIKQITLLTIIE